MLWFVARALQQLDPILRVKVLLVRTHSQATALHASTCLHSCLEAAMLIPELTSPGAGQQPVHGAGTWRTLTNGAPESLASRRAISVLPQPVGPIMRMFLGTISSCTSMHLSKQLC